MKDYLKKDIKKIISIHISSKLSGTQQAARVAKGMVAQRRKYNNSRF